MSLPTAATVSVEIDAPAEVIYDLIADVTRMGDWSPECKRCDWLDEPGRVGSKFRGYNRRGLARWSTTAEVLVADRAREFSFATLHRGQPATQWTYRLDGDRPTVLAESFKAIRTPRLIALVEGLFIRNRQQQLEVGIAQTLAAIRATAEAQQGDSAASC